MFVGSASEEVCIVGFRLEKGYIFSGHLSPDGSLQFDLQGLKTPILKNADQNSLSDISSEVFLLDLWYCNSFHH